MNPSRNLFLIGPMGAGKTTVGKRLAAHFGLPFLDLDAEIESHTGVDVPLIFDIEGEPGFRRRESVLLAECSAREGVVLATGGGAILDAENRALLAARGFVVWLQTRVEQQLQRLERDRHRPLLQSADRRERLEAMARARDPLYAEVADLVVPSHAQTPAHAAEQVARELERHWQRIPQARIA
ncbi:MAG TPA: shikimate kinase AroK [Rhodanobacteraceae bacterium]|nr:shikimate kinase AroK [Rhodanobacteraceae bacterium]